MDASEPLGVLALLLGLGGSIANGYAATRQLSGSRLNLTDEAAETARTWSFRGWFLIGSRPWSG